MISVYWSIQELCRAGLLTGCVSLTPSYSMISGSVTVEALLSCGHPQLESLQAVEIDDANRAVKRDVRSETHCKSGAFFSMSKCKAYVFDLRNAVAIEATFRCEEE